MTTSENPNDTQERAQAKLFKKEQQQRDAGQAMADYRAEEQAQRDKTARLRAQRLAREAAAGGGAPDAAAATAGKAAKKPRSR